MAHQHSKKEETTSELPSTERLRLTLCVNNCGLYGSPATNDMCTSCFQSRIRPNSPSGSSALRTPRSGPLRPAESEARREGEEQAAAEADRPPAAVARKAASRCLKCGKRVGLTGFRCRCGDLFCGDHRYSDRHDCGFDFKALGRERIQRENPLVRAAKVVRI